MSGAITQYIDVAQIVLYVFWAFFAGLIFYLHREGKREGYPLVREDAPNDRVEGFPAMPEATTYYLRDGTTRVAPTGNSGRDDKINATSAGGHPGAPYEPIGNPMLAGVGPGAYAIRPDIPDKTVDGANKIVPLRVATGFHLESKDPNPIGMNVVAGDGNIAGVVTDVWVDRAEILIRYLEVKVAEGGRTVLIPMNFARVTPNELDSLIFGKFMGGMLGSKSEGNVKVRSIFAKHFTDVPGTKNPESVTMMEEERIMAYYGAGTLYASADRSEPLL